MLKFIQVKLFAFALTSLFVFLLVSCNNPDKMTEVRTNIRFSNGIAYDFNVPFTGKYLDSQKWSKDKKLLSFKDGIKDGESEFYIDGQKVVTMTYNKGLLKKVKSFWPEDVIKTDFLIGNNSHGLFPIDYHLSNNYLINIDFEPGLPQTYKCNYLLENKLPFSLLAASFNKPLNELKKVFGEPSLISNEHGTTSYLYTFIHYREEDGHEILTRVIFAKNMIAILYRRAPMFYLEDLYKIIEADGFINQKNYYSKNIEGETYKMNFEIPKNNSRVSDDLFYSVVQDFKLFIKKG